MGTWSRLGEGVGEHVPHGGGPPHHTPAGQRQGGVQGCCWEVMREGGASRL